MRASADPALALVASGSVRGEKVGRVGSFLVHLGPLPALRFNLAFQKFDYKQVLGIPDAHANIVSGTGGLQISLLPGPVRPYVTAGLGAFQVRNVADSANGTTASKVHFGIDGGAGLAVSIGRVSAFGEGAGRTSTRTTRGSSTGSRSRRFR
ncbi:MAG: hypothetical protein JJD97_14510 [Gemmatimonadaceae bacterium]|nr:hypothetical protein [Gemmatimonadaceae bacterium]